MKPRELLNIGMETLKEWQEDQAARLAAGMAYYTTFSLAPLLVLVLAITGLFGGRDAAQGLVMDQVEDLVGTEGREFVGSMIENASSSSTGVTASVLGAITLLIGALGAFNELQNALNRIWDVEPKPIKGWGKRVMNFFFKPDVEINWNNVWLGALITAILFTLGKFLIGLYLGRSDVGNTFGAAGSMVLIMVWVYYSSQILFLGGEFTQVYAKRTGEQPRPDQHAIEGKRKRNPLIEEPVES